MAKLTTRYDRELKEKVFVLRGEEGYARTTDCILDEILHDPTETGIDPETGRRIDWNNTIGYMLLEFRLDVLRDIGASYVVLYDNDEMLGVYDFDTNTHTIEFAYNENPDLDTRLKLAYGVEHNLYAKYMGNKHCLKSESKKYNFNEPVPSHFESQLVFDEIGSVEFGQSISVGVTLSAHDNYGGQTIYLYDGSTLLGTATTDSTTGKATFTNISFNSDGIHTLSARYNGSEHLYSSSATYDVSVGYRLIITNYPSYLINSNMGSVTVSAIDYHGRPVSGKSIYIANDVAWESLSQEVTTNNDGIAVFNQVAMMSYPYYAQCSEDSSHIYKSESVTTHIYNSVGITASANPIRIDNAGETVITGQVNQNTTVDPSTLLPSGGVPLDSPITLTVKAFDYKDDIILTDTVTTNATGGFTYNYFGSNSGNSALVFEASDNVYANVGIRDVIQYWKLGGTSLNRTYHMDKGELNQLTNYYQFKTVLYNGNYYGNLVFTNYIPFEGDWQLSLIIKQVSGINMIGAGVDRGALRISNPSLRNGSEVMFYRTDNTIGVFIDGVEVKNAPISGNNDGFRLEIAGSNGSFIGFDELELIKDRFGEI